MKKTLSAVSILALLFGIGLLYGCNDNNLPSSPGPNPTIGVMPDTLAPSQFSSGPGKRTTIKYRDGRTIEATFQPYLSMRGTSTATAHPANETVPLPVGSDSDLFIPFEATFKNTTEGSYSADANVRMRFGNGYSGSLIDGNISSSFEYIHCAHGDSLGELKIVNDNFGSRENDLSWTHLASEEYGFVYGCVVVKNFYSPAYPTGILEAYPPIDTLLESMNFPSRLPQNFIEFSFDGSDDGTVYWFMEPKDNELQMLRIIMV